MNIKKRLHTIIILFFVTIAGLNCNSTTTFHLTKNSSPVKTGLDIFTEKNLEIYKDKKIMLITNHSGRNSNLRQNLEILRDKGLRITTLCAPEHGINGSQQSYDKRIMIANKSKRIMIYNLHKLSIPQLRFIMKNHDIAIFDIQDMGMRCYTYITNLKRTIDAAQKLQTELIVLDRPNPAGFIGLQGFNLEKKHITRFVSVFPAPLFYNLTIGEAAYYYNQKTGSNVKLTVVKMEGYKSGMMFHKTGLPWIPPSPNLPTYESAIMYTITVLMEGINISLGRGTSKPFEYIGAPWIRGEEMAHDLNRIKIKGFRFRPVFFTPAFSNFSKRECSGVHIYYTGEKYDPLEASYKIMTYLLKKYPRYIRWVKKDRFYWIDALAGTDKIRKGLIEKTSYSIIRQKAKNSTREYRKIFSKYKFY